ncbi:MAG: ATP-binding cassette domain-containing protein [Planctomycetota bacterium]|nr:ATP-binding cassette domain-containing protein [Planctomycetota bacterium]
MLKSKSVIKVCDIRKQFNNEHQTVIAVDNLSFEVTGGEVYGLLGPNGAGKTTTLRMILGLLQPDAGYAEVSGYRTSVDAFEVKRRIGFVSATIGLYQWLTAREVLLFFADVYGVESKQAQTNVDEIVEIFSLEEIIDQRCATLSTGQKQKINLARALIHKPPVMLLDEPTLGLDVVGSKAVFDYIDLLRSQEKAIIVSTHRLDEAQRLCDRFGLIFEGVLREEGTLAELQNKTGKSSLVEMFLKILETKAEVDVRRGVTAEPGLPGVIDEKLTFEQEQTLRDSKEPRAENGEGQND